MGLFRLSAREKKPRYYKFSAINFNPYRKRTGEVEDKINELINILNRQKEQFQKIKDIADIVIEINYKGYKDEMWGIHIKNETLAKIAELCLDIDIDLYASGPDLPF